jgi:hypothetical protein
MARVNATALLRAWIYVMGSFMSTVSVINLGNPKGLNHIGLFFFKINPRPSAAPIVFQVLHDDLEAGDRACSRIHLCPEPAPSPIVPDKPYRTSNLSDTTGEKPWGAWNSTEGVGYFIHLTDQHLVSSRRLPFAP